ncbi:2,4'-dihydroxyacetophenone dioxygenase family protein [Oceanibacterium hippocampi]|uniref:ChrR-like cupin domain-containing protein n=1 Tax=Oceanibacterium hippocampi TaxID=745714 RepID=A0A1Y5TZ37_9PROT|nr:2,4'-dihydroxyacetophenone dioxygenase family protein [Oceanibacterium hippocampi]SLN74668.1 hypothetical protein OCH7691_03789 [Oceanibacterium hippocampi]
MNIQSTSVLSDDEQRILSRIAHYGITDQYIDTDESLWHPFVGDELMLKPLRFDLRNSLYVCILWAKQPGVLGRHRHRSPVTGFTLEGGWRYAEYDWVAKPGDLVQENPGAIHTLIAEKGMKTLFFVNGSLEFYDEHDVLQDTMDVFSFLDLYVSHCDANGLPVNERLIF